MTNRERFHAVMGGMQADRLPMIEWATYWDKTIERWHGEGLPGGLDEEFAIREHFGLDAYRQIWIASRSAKTPRPAFHGAPIARDEAGYEALLPTLYPFPPVPPERLEGIAKEQAGGGLVFWITLDGFFWGPRALLGIQEHLLAFYDQPALMRRINEDLCDYNERCIEYVCRYTTPDFMTFGEDMNYNNGSMISKALFEEFMAPYYRRITPMLKKRNIRIIVDSDGDVSDSLGWFLEAGAEGVLPLERQAGVDIGALMTRYPGALFIGGYDKMVMTGGEAAMRAEFERLLPAMRRGRFIPSVDHQTPPGVSLEQYRLYIALLKEYTAKGA
jgi:hypothetical protein